VVEPCVNTQGLRGDERDRVFRAVWNSEEWIPACAGMTGRIGRWRGVGLGGNGFLSAWERRAMGSVARRNAQGMGFCLRGKDGGGGRCGRDARDTCFKLEGRLWRWVCIYDFIWAQLTFRYATFFVFDATNSLYGYKLRVFSSIRCC